MPALADLSLPQAPVAFGAGLALGRDTSTAGNVEHVDLSGQYFLCEYLAGTVENRDSSENVSAIFVARRDLSKFIPADRIYPPVLRALEEFDERPSHR